MAKFKKLLEQVKREDPFSPFFDTARQMTPDEIEFLETHESEPSSSNTEVPPAQIEWQWQDGDLVYNCHLVKEVFDDSRNTAINPENPDTPKRYKLMGFVYNKTNNLTGLVTDYTFVSPEFSEEADLEVLEAFLQDKSFLYDNETEEMKIFTFTRPSDFEF